jgi:transaldolase
MIKIPGTPQGIPAIAETVGSGINVNVTLLFGLNAYEAAANAYLDGLAALARAGRDLARMASVASFFVSRVDTVVDKQLVGHPKAARLSGQAAIANARLAYARFQEIFSGPRWAALAAQGARVQRPLWASTSTKNPAYPDTMYVDSLIGPHTVNTAPPQTLEAFVDHGVLAETVTKGVDEAAELMTDLAQVGIDMDQITDHLLREGVEAFTGAFAALKAGLQHKVAILSTT